MRKLIVTHLYILIQNDTVFSVFLCCSLTEKCASVKVHTFAQVNVGALSRFNRFEGDNSYYQISAPFQLH